MLGILTIFITGYAVYIFLSESFNPLACLYVKRSDTLGRILRVRRIFALLLAVIIWLGGAITFFQEKFLFSELQGARTWHLDSFFEWGKYSALITVPLLLIVLPFIWKDLRKRPKLSGSGQAVNPDRTEERTEETRAAHEALSRSNMHTANSKQSYRSDVSPFKKNTGGNTIDYEL